ncbi:MAG: class I SAM-dependent methyltransferase, partial [Acidobacteria bacterium]
MTVRQHFDPSRLFWDAAYRDGDDHEHWNDGGGAEGASVYGQPVFLSWLDQELADEGRLVLDVGCGRGGLIGELAGRSPGRAVRWLGVDLSLAALAGAGDGGCGPRRRSPVALVAARAAALPLAAASVDAVVERGMLHGFEPPARQRALAELARGLRPSCR